MKQSCDSPFAMEEIEVANIMLKLPHLIFESEFCPRFSLTWASRRKRSVASKEEVAATSSPALKLSPSPPPSLPSFIGGSTFDTVGPIEKVLYSSPATPLSFSPSESDEKPQPSKKKPSVNSLRRKKELFLEMLEDFTHRNELLKKDIEIKRRFLDQQITENLELKSKKQKCQSLLTPEELPLETSKSLNLEMQLTQISMETKNTTAVSQDCHHHHQQQRTSSRVYQQPFIMDQMDCKSDLFRRMISWLPSDTVGSSKVLRNVDLHGIPDLNVSAEEGFGFSLGTVTKTMAAQARLKRKQICRAKNFNAVCKTRYPLR